MQELYTLLANAPSFIQVLVLVLSLIGIYVIIRFRYIVTIIAAGAIALWVSIKRKR